MNNTFFEIKRSSLFKGNVLVKEVEVVEGLSSYLISPIKMRVWRLSRAVCTRALKLWMQLRAWQPPPSKLENVTKDRGRGAALSEESHVTVSLERNFTGAQRILGCFCQPFRGPWATDYSSTTNFYCAGVKDGLILYDLRPAFKESFSSVYLC